MEKEDFKNLEEGDIIQNKFSGKGYIVGSNCGRIGVIVVTTLLATNHCEWNLVRSNKKDSKNHD